MKPFIELLIATLFWGATFPAVVFALREFEIGALLFYRFFVAGALGTVGVLVAQHLSQKSFSWKQHLLLLKDSFWPGFFLAATILPQTWGIHASTATEAAFITTLYVVIVPLLSPFWLKTSFDLRHSLTAVVALFGTALLVQFGGTELKLASFVLLINACFAAAHILSLENIKGKNIHPFLWNSYQSLWCALLCAPGLLWSQAPRFLDFKATTWIAFCLLTFGASMISFYLQVRAQRFLKPNTVSLLFVLESVFASFFAWIFLGESLTPTQILGATIILGTCAWASLRKI